MRTMYPDTSAIAVFAKVVELGNFRAAARALALSKSTASSRIASLEEHLGTRLIERTTRAVRITDAGRTYHRHILLALEALRDGERAMEGLQAEPRGRLRVTAPLDFDVVLLASLLGEYQRRLPGVEVGVDLTDRRVDLLEEGIDIALREGPLEDSSLIVRKLGAPQRLRTYASPEYLRRRGTPTEPQALEQHDCLAMGGHQEPRSWRYYAGRQLRIVSIRAHITVNSFAVLKQLAISGQGIVRLPERQANVAVAQGHLRPILDNYAPPPRALHALHARAPYVATKVTAFLDLLDSLLHKD